MDGGRQQEDLSRQQEDSSPHSCPTADRSFLRPHVGNGIGGLMMGRKVDFTIQEQ